MKNPFLSYAAINGFVVVALGAFGAHALEARLDADMLAIFQTGVQYQMFHVIGLVAVHVLMAGGTAVRGAALAGYLFLAGIVLFSGSLYLLALTGITALGIITPLGGLCFLAAWGQLARLCFRQRK
jgi:uncharacterized membrane protein YgdD (TMEM256/DUF423 family)